jgi:hypothetical protein
MMSSPPKPRRSSEHGGYELFEVQPVILGGSPTDPRNKVLLSREKHIEAVRYWNRVIKDLRQQNTG